MSVVRQARKWLAGGDYSIAKMASRPAAHYVERHGFDSAHDDSAHDKAPAAPSRRPALYVERHGDRPRQIFGRTRAVPAADHSAATRFELH